uniref:Prohead protease n=1 Tax=viral metagenome TaxID=1070528 RepID=A0A6H1ZNZ5_9ZZZZ
MKKEFNPIIAENFIVEYVAPITFVLEKFDEKLSGKRSPLKISGVAIDETISYNNLKYTKEELKKAAPSLSDKPILKDHKNEIDSLVGRTGNSYFNETQNSIPYDGLIMDEKTIEMIEDGRIKNVSIGAKVEKLRRENPKDSNSPLIAEGISFLELSVTPVQGVQNATISQAISEKFNLGDKMVEEENETPVETPEEGSKETPEETPVETPAEPEKPAEATSTEALKKMLREVVREELRIKEKPKGKGIVANTVKQERVQDNLIRERTREGLTIYSLDEKLVYGESVNQVPQGVKIKG